MQGLNKRTLQGFAHDIADLHKARPSNANAVESPIVTINIAQLWWSCSRLAWRLRQKLLSLCSGMCTQVLRSALQEKRLDFSTLHYEFCHSTVSAILHACKTFLFQEHQWWKQFQNIALRHALDRRFYVSIPSPAKCLMRPRNLENMAVWCSIVQLQHSWKKILQRLHAHTHCESRAPEGTAWPLHRWPDQARQQAIADPVALESVRQARDITSTLHSCRCSVEI